MENNYIEWLGYFASVTIAISLTMSNIKYLRWFNLVGALAFSVYGWQLQLYPVLIVNLFIVCVNIFYLFQFAGDKNIVK
ncbi:MAG: hypothetical protein HN657_05650 [Candidatus Marinimicrobia bacterium]|jgi:hypothetical protein|nr:hypothetical protein [Candidatus Neomarinimicrobiota bacterium]MBT3496992.1 hypothetical protein [Candidatus Neomarinimicrobiota bacterium]MBT3691863.1 hypothetical protein [Candidatus Neomarinimicrobiota bacterium]MBT3731507.1 hypothetical protein [Candidatus Neomarinimicrobiota bacterium]MBT4144713.1 hypothetical protein [Candidatus Neomarinimicrobiota bacterium]